MGIGQHGGGVAVLDPVVRRFDPIRIAGHAALLAQVAKVGAAAREDLVHIGLVTGVPQDDVPGRVEHPVDGEGELHHAQVGSKVPARHGDRMDDELPDLSRQLDQFGGIERFEISRRFDGLQQHATTVAVARPDEPPHPSVVAPGDEARQGGELGPGEGVMGASARAARAWAVERFDALLDLGPGAGVGQHRLDGGDLLGAPGRGGRNGSRAGRRPPRGPGTGRWRTARVGLPSRRSSPTTFPRSSSVAEGTEQVVAQLEGLAQGHAVARCRDPGARPDDRPGRHRGGAAVRWCTCPTCRRRWCGPAPRWPAVRRCRPDRDTGRR